MSGGVLPEADAKLLVGAHRGPCGAMVDGTYDL